MTRRALLTRMRERLAPAPAAADDAALLLAHVLGIPSIELIAHSEKSVPFLAMLSAGRLTARRARGMPIAYLTGRRSFYGRDLFVNKHTLIPRPESECLVELVLAQGPFDTIIDIGTGSGALAISLATVLHDRNDCTRPPTPFILATDRSRSALRMARRNARLHKTLIHFFVGDLLDALPPRLFTNIERGCLIANLPYLTEAMLTQSPQEVSKHEPHSALVSDTQDGLDLYRRLLAQLQKRRQEFPPALTLLFEIDPTQSALLYSAVHNIFPSAEITVHADLRGHDRVVLVRP